MDFCIPQAKIVHNRGKPTPELPVLPLSPLPWASRDSSQEPSQLPSQALDNMAWGAASRPPRTAAPGLLQSFPTRGFPAAMPALRASSLSALPSRSPSPPGGSSSCLVERLCERGLQQLRLSPAVLLALSTSLMQCLAGPVPYQSSIHSRLGPSFPRRSQGWAAVPLGPWWKAQGSQGPGWEPSE